MFNVIIAGGRDYNNFQQLTATMDAVLVNKSQVTIISGGANGADSLGERYARLRGYPLIVMKADWGKHGKRAGYLRNVDMFKAASAAVCFWNGISRGTAHMIDITMEGGKPLRVIRY